jgi:hypothetical protein
MTHIFKNFIEIEDYSPYKVFFESAEFTSYLHSKLTCGKFENEITP